MPLSAQRRCAEAVQVTGRNAPPALADGHMLLFRRGASVNRSGLLRPGRPSDSPGGLSIGTLPFSVPARGFSSPLIVKALYGDVHSRPSQRGASQGLIRVAVLVARLVQIVFESSLLLHHACGILLHEIQPFPGHPVRDVRCWASIPGHEASVSECWHLRGCVFPFYYLQRPASRGQGHYLVQRGQWTATRRTCPAWPPTELAVATSPGTMGAERHAVP